MGYTGSRNRGAVTANIVAEPIAVRQWAVEGETLECFAGRPAAPPPKD